MGNQSIFAVLSGLAVSVFLGTGCSNFERPYDGHDDNKALSLNAVPAAVQAAAKKAAGTNTIESIVRETEDSQDTYEVSFEVDDIEHTVSLKPDGTIIEEETEMKVANLPALVSAAVLKAQPLARVKEASTVKRDGQSYFEIDAKIGEDKHELNFGSDGKLIADRVEADEDKKGENQHGWAGHGKGEKGEHHGEHKDED